MTQILFYKIKNNKNCPNLFSRHSKINTYIIFFSLSLSSFSNWYKELKFIRELLNESTKSSIMTVLGECSCVNVAAPAWYAKRNFFCINLWCLSYRKRSNEIHRSTSLKISNSVGFRSASDILDFHWFKD